MAENRAKKRTPVKKSPSTKKTASSVISKKHVQMDDLPAMLAAQVGIPEAHFLKEEKTQNPQEPATVVRTWNRDTTGARRQIMIVGVSITAIAAATLAALQISTLFTSMGWQGIGAEKNMLSEAGKDLSTIGATTAAISEQAKAIKNEAAEAYTKAKITTALAALLSSTSTKQTAAIPTTTRPETPTTTAPTSTPNPPMTTATEEKIIPTIVTP